MIVMTKVRRILYDHYYDEMQEVIDMDRIHFGMFVYNQNWHRLPPVMVMERIEHIKEKIGDYILHYNKDSRAFDTKFSIMWYVINHNMIMLTGDDEVDEVERVVGNYPDLINQIKNGNDKAMNVLLYKIKVDSNYRIDMKNVTGIVIVS